MTRSVLFAAATAALVWMGSVPALAAEPAAKPDPADTYPLLNLFGDVFERVRSDYVEEVSDKELIEAAITGMLTSLDPHSSYLSADNFKEMQVQTRGEFGGLGVQVTMENGLIKVISPIDETPAARAGIEPNDIVTHLDGEPVAGMDLSQAVDRMRGPVGTDISLTVRRGESEPFDVVITRAIIKIRSVRSRIIDGDVGYMRITSFNEQTDVGVKKALDKFKEEAGPDLKGIVIDLRNNPGGLLDQAIAVADVFLDHGEIVSTRSRVAEDSQRFNARAGDLTDNTPLVVLINGGSASASEIVAGALQDHKRALVLGTRSFGKGSVQTIIPMSSHGAMRLTTARYYTPSGRSIQAVGIEPDIKVAQAKIEAVEQPAGLRREQDLRGALKNDNGDEEEGNAPAAPAPQDESALPDDEESDSDADAAQAEEKPEDYQLARAVDLLRGLAVFGKLVSR